MPESSPPQQKREFRCIHCNGTIAIPYELPPTTAPCPHCSNLITSPAVEAPPIGRIPDPPATVDLPASVGQAPTPASPTSASPTPAPTPGPSPTPPSATRKTAKSALVPAFLVLLLIGLCGAIAFAVHQLRKRQPTPGGDEPVAENPTTHGSPYRKIGWQTEAYEVLTGFLKARTVAEKLPYVVKSPGLEERMNDFYGGGVIDDADTPADAFSSFGSTPEDQERGIFLLTYYRPEQFTLKDFFRPVAPISVEWGLEEADSLLAAVANASNFTADSLSAMAFFLRTPEGLKLDWDTFVQTKYGTLQSFLEVPERNHTGVFRVVIWEDVAETGKDSQGFRTYQVVPPTDPGGGVRVKVATDSDLGKCLSVINWRRVAGLPKQTTRTATVELKWIVDPEPRVVLNRLICWEFLGLGGKEGNHLAPSEPQPNPASIGQPKTAPDGGGKP